MTEIIVLGGVLAALILLASWIASRRDRFGNVPVDVAGGQCVGCGRRRPIHDLHRNFDGTFTCRDCAGTGDR